MNRAVSPGLIYNCLCSGVGEMRIRHKAKRCTRGVLGEGPSVFQIIKRVSKRRSFTQRTHTRVTQTLRGRRRATITPPSC